MTGGEGTNGYVPAMRSFVAWWLVLAGLWLVLADKSELAELCAAVVAGGLGAAAAVAARSHRDVTPQPQVRWVARLVRPLAAVPRDLWLLVRALALAGAGRAPAGEVCEVAFDTTADPPGAARRMLAAAGGSLPPNTVVIGFDDHRGTILVHRLLDAGDPRDAADPMELAQP